MKVTALVLQTWFDIAARHTGSASNAYAIALHNGSSITDVITPGQLVVIPDTVVVDVKTVNYLTGKEAMPATGFTSSELEQINPTLGIGTMAISATFIVQ